MRGSHNPGHVVLPDRSTELMAVAVKCCREKFVHASRFAERKRLNVVGDRAAVLALRHDGRLPVELH